MSEPSNADLSENHRRQGDQLMTDHERGTILLDEDRLFTEGRPTCIITTGFWITHSTMFC